MRHAPLLVVAVVLALAVTAAPAGAATWRVSGQRLYAMATTPGEDILITPRSGTDAAAVTLATETWPADADAHPALRLEDSNHTLVVERSAAVKTLDVGDGSGSAGPFDITVRGGAAWSVDLDISVTAPGTTLALTAGAGGADINLGGHQLLALYMPSISVATDIRNGDAANFDSSYLSLARDVRIAARYVETGPLIGGGHALAVDGEWFIESSTSGLTGLDASGLTRLANDLSVTETATFETLAVYANGPHSIAAAETIIRGTTTSEKELIADACDVGTCGRTDADLTVIGAARFSDAVSLGSLQVIGGTATLGGNVTTVGSQTYNGDAVIALGANPLTLAAGAGAQVTFGSDVSARWPSVAGADGYTATIKPSGRTCTSTRVPTCAFGAVAAARSHRFSVAAKSADGDSAENGTPATARPVTVRRGSRTPLARIVRPPAKAGRRVWSERGPCSIRKNMLVAPKRTGTCTVTLRVTTGPNAGWRRRAIVTVS